MDYDVFLSHNSKDKPSVQALKQRLEKAGLCVWYDEERLTPGRNSQPEMEQGIRASSTVVVCIGADSLGPWETEEVEAAIRIAVHDALPVIPVLLESAPAEARSPLFLGNRTWVDLRGDVSGDAFARLVSGITKPPNDQQQGPRQAASRHGPKPAPTSPTVPVTATPIRIFLAAPGDLADERRQVRELIESLHLDLGGRAAVEAIAWDKPGGGAPLLATMRPQEAIEAGLPRPSKCDIVVVLFGYRIGTRLDPAWQTKPDGKPYRSGTEWEYLDALRGSELGGLPAILVYRRNGSPTASLSDMDELQRRVEQWQAVDAFFADFTNPDGSERRGYNRFDHPSDLCEQLRGDLVRLIEKRLAATPVAEDPMETVRADWDRPPYPGLVAFTRDQAPIFFGRERKVDELKARLAEPANRIIALVGASGTGKSSLIRAGLLDRLAKGALSGSQDWLVAELTPAGSSDDPLRNLATAIKYCRPGLAWSERDKALELRQGGWPGLVDEVLAGTPDWAELVVFVDQFEELFRLVPDGDGGKEDHRTPFVTWLGQTLNVPRVRLILTLRADFVPDCLRHQALTDLLNAGQVALTSPGPFERKRMVTEPARRAGLKIDDGLADRIAADTGDEPGALPLMAYALERLHAADGASGELTLGSYDAFGGVEGAIASQASKVFDAFARKHGDAPALQARERLFSELVSVDEGGTATRRRAPLSCLERLHGDAALARRLADALVAARLLVFGHDVSAGAVVDVAHEALLHAWNPLRVWISNRRDDLRLYRLLGDEVRRWAASGYRTKHLRSDAWVQDVRAALSRLPAEPNTEQRAYLDPDARAPFLLTRDIAVWRAAGRGAAHLWDHDRFAGCIELPSGAIGEQDADTRAFLQVSFDAAIAAEHAHPQRRAEIGRTLALLGDPRFDPAHWHLPDDPTLGFIEIPPGRFLMGTDPAKEPPGWDDEQPQHEQRFERAYWIGRFPVTVAQFQAFADATDHNVEPMALEGLATQPVVYVSWHDARAYCDWLQQRFAELAAECVDVTGVDGAGRFWSAVAGGAIKAGLPSEPEWERAARGAESRVYPWGPDGSPLFANYKDTRIGGPSVVGCFPAGASPDGCSDMAGNVWEWTRSHWGEDFTKIGRRYPYDAKDGREDLDASDEVIRVLRGGGFAGSSDYLRCAARYRDLPRYRNGGGGFRVVWSPFL